VEAEYLETGDGELRTITCVVCHAAHGSPYGGQLRASIETPDRDHLCVRCHARTGTPWSARGPHAAQGLLLLDEDVGYRPPGFSFPDAAIRNNHGPDNNPSLCTTCHVVSRTVTDPDGGFLLESVGHTFQAATCVDQNGIPTVKEDCPPAERSFAGCVGSGCHGGEWSARSAYVKIRGRLNTLLDELWEDVDGDRILESSDGGVLPQVIALGFGADLDPDDPTLTPAKGAMWNAMLAWTDDRPQWSDGEVGGASFSSHPNSGNGVHNPHLLEALLLASIGHVRDTYGARPSPAFDPTPHLAGGPASGPEKE
jgi:predicted CXXCH cytochrome family protein